jgi:hypothetical protein
MVLHEQSLNVICEMIWGLEEDADISKITDLPTYKRVIKAQLEQRGHSFSEKGIDETTSELSLRAEILDTKMALDKNQAQFHELKSVIVGTMSGLEAQHKELLEKQKQITIDRYAVEGAMQVTRQLIEKMSNLSTGTQP